MSSCVGNARGTNAAAQPVFDDTTWVRAPAEPLSAWLLRLAWPFALAVLLWMVQLTPQLGVATDWEDGSYQSAMDHFFATGARCGVDWIYTYGPLGACQALTYHPDVVWTKLVVWELVFKFVTTLAIVRALWRARDPFQRYVPYLLVLCAPNFGDPVLFVALLACTDLAIEQPRSRARALTAIVVLVLAGLSKNTALFLSGPLVAAIVFTRWRMLGAQAAVTFFAAFAALWLGIWIACGQSPLDVPIFLVRSLQLASAYNAGLATEAPANVDAVCLTALAAGTCAALLACWRRERPLDSLVRTAVHVLVFYVAFKAGLVRGVDHASIFTMFAAVAPFVAAPLAELAPGLRRGAACALRWSVPMLVVPLSYWLLAYGSTVMLGIGFHTGSVLQAAVDFLMTPRNHVAAADADYRYVSKTRALPATRAVVGDATVDIHAPYQDAVLMNHFRWHPRPVFQPYAALSEPLELVNERFLASDDAPEFYMLRFTPMDAHMATMEDAGALRVLARDYVPVVTERGYVTFRRAPRSEAPAPAPVVVLDRTARLGEKIDVSQLAGECLLLQLEAHPTLAGRLHSLVLRVAELDATVELANGGVRRVRVLPAMLVHGAIFSPWIDTADDWLHWQNGGGLRVTSITIDSPAVAGYWADEIRLRVVRDDGLAPRDVEKSRALVTTYEMLRTAPQRAATASLPIAIVVEGELVLEVGPKAALYYDVGPGKHRTRGRFGLVPETYNGGATDGAGFQVLVRDASGGKPKVLLRRVLDPVRRAEDRGTQSFELEFECAVPSQLVFRTLAGPAGDPTDDRAYWTAIEVE